jgi:PAS domain S-box-containing protein
MRRRYKKFIIPGLVFLASLALTCVAGFSVRYNVEQQLSMQFQNQTQEITDLFQNRMDLYTNVLFGAQGLFAASQIVEPDEWDAYANALNAPHNYAGISALLYIEHVPRAASSSYPYVIYPPSAAGDYYPITYIASVSSSSAATSSQSAYGFDASSDPVRDQAMMLAVNSGSLAASGVVMSITTHVPVFGIYAPVYLHDASLNTPDQRWAALQGFAVATFRIKDLFEGLTADPVFDNDIALEIYDTPALSGASTSTLLYDTDNSAFDALNPAARHSLARTTTIIVAGRTWTLYFSALASYRTVGVTKYVYYATLAVGIFLSFLLAWILYMFSDSREQALAVAQRITKDLAQSQALFHLSIDNAGDMFFLCNAAGGIIETNKRASELLGYTREEILMLSIPDLDVQENDKPYQVPFEELKKGVTVRMEGELKRKDSSYIDIEATINIFETQQKQFILALVRDVTKRKEKETAERKQRAKDEAILSSISDGLVVTDLQGRVLSVNRTFEKELGWKSEEVLGKKFVDIVPLLDEKGNSVGEKDRLIVQALEKRSLQTTADISSAYYQRKDGSRFPAYIAVTPIYLGADLLGAVEVFRDVSREKEIDKAKTEFVSLASHQLRTPLSAIGWYAELLVDGEAGAITKQQKEFLTQIRESNQRMVELVNSLLNVSRIDLGTLASEPVPTDSKALAKSVIAELKPQMEERQLQIRETYDDKVPSDMLLDPKLMRIIIQNLLSNAVKYTPEKGTITLTFAAQGKDFLCEVADTGYGIPESQQGKIFTKLFRADNAKEKDPDGNGLGLYLVKAIVEAQRGRIWFDSQEGTGTTFHVTLPLSGMKKIDGSKTLN